MERSLDYIQRNKEFLGYCPDRHEGSHVQDVLRHWNKIMTSNQVIRLIRNEIEIVLESDESSNIKNAKIDEKLTEIDDIEKRILIMIDNF